MDLNDLNPQQRAAVEFNGNHVLVLAGAGTGKTCTIISRVVYLISQGVQPNRIQILSFTRKSAGEIVERVKSMFSNSDAKQLRGCTFHSWCTNIIKSNPKVFSFSNFTLLEPEDQIDAFKLMLGKTKIVIEETRLKPSVFRDVYSYAVNTQCSLTDAIRKLVYNNKNDDLTNKSINENKHHFQEVIKKYIDYKASHGQMDYDDILQSVVNVLTHNAKAREYIAQKYDHILVDEMQDTNPLQWALLSLFQPYCHLFCVGDDAQSIYAFRGADFKNVHSFKERVPDSEVLKLEENYRSTQEILDVSNWLLEQSPLDYNKQLKAIRGEGEMPILMHFDSDWEEANWISDDIIKNITEESKSYKDHMALSRTGQGLRVLEATFIQKKIPYQIFGGTQLLKSRHIRDVLSALKIIANIHDELAWMRYLRLWPGIGEVTAAKYIERILTCKSIDDCLDFLKDNTIKSPALVKTLDAIKPLNTQPDEAIHQAVQHMEKQLCVFYPDWGKRVADFKLLEQIAKPHPTINEFITEFVLDPSLNESHIENGESAKDLVTLSTIHSAKGLEADICYVLNVSPGLYPLRRAITEGNEAVEEERRCLYVALTRAKNRLIVTRNLNSIQSYDDLLDEILEDDDGLELSESDVLINEEGTTSYFFNGIPEILFDNLTPKEESLDKKSDYEGESSSWYPWRNFNYD